MERICEISQIRSARYLPASSRRRKKRNLRTDDSLRGPGGASLPAANVPVVLPSSTRPIRRGFPSPAAACRECVTHRESTRVFFPSALGGTFLRFSSAPPLLSHSLSSLAALCLFLFPPTPDAANCAHPDEILVPSAPRLASLSLPSPLVDPSSSKKTRSRYTAALFARARRNHGFFIFADCSCYCGRADDHSLLDDIAGQTAA